MLSKPNLRTEYISLLTAPKTIQPNAFHVFMPFWTKLRRFDTIFIQPKQNDIKLGTEIQNFEPARRVQNVLFH